MKRTTILLLLAVAPALAMAQSARIRLPEFPGLASKATEAVDIDLDGDTLRMASAFLGGGKGAADADFVETVKGLQGIYLKVYSFDKPGQYSMRDIEPLVAQVQAQGWKKLLSVRDREDRVEMWLRDNSTEGGMFFVASEPTELVLINIVGKVDLETLRKLQGRMGVPQLPGMAPMPPAPPAPPAPAPAAAAAPPAAPAPPATRHEL